MNSNNLPNQKEENSVSRLFQFGLIGKLTSENQSRMSTFWKALALQDECLFWNSLDPDHARPQIPVLFKSPNSGQLKMFIYKIQVNPIHTI